MRGARLNFSYSFCFQISLNLMQTVQTLIRRRVMRRLIWVCAVCQCSFLGHEHNWFIYLLDGLWFSGLAFLDTFIYIFRLSRWILRVSASTHLWNCDFTIEIEIEVNFGSWGKHQALEWSRFVICSQFRKSLMSLKFSKDRETILVKVSKIL